MNRGYYAALAERLAARHRVITLDWRGHGDSGRAPTDFGHEGLADDAMAVIEASGVRRIVPVTQAHGGWAAVELRRRLGDPVEKIVAAKLARPRSPADVRCRAGGCSGSGAVA
jgi:pimeloyl-ACP methyl ester carboxylesterase